VIILRSTIGVNHIANFLVIIATRMNNAKIVIVRLLKPKNSFNHVGESVGGT
jgi:hypothetical protein